MKTKEEVFVTNNFEETQDLGKEFVARRFLYLLSTQAQDEALSNVIALYGELGGGKTTFVQGLAKGLGIKKRIISPTFIIVRSYKIKIPVFAKASAGKQNSKLFYHIDLYRVEGDDNIKGLGLEEIINDPQNIVAIEWAEKIRRLLPKDRWDVTFEYVDQNKRRITIKNGRN